LVHTIHFTTNERENENSEFRDPYLEFGVLKKDTPYTELSTPIKIFFGLTGIKDSGIMSNHRGIKMASGELKIVLEEVKEKFDTVIEAFNMVKETLDRHKEENRKEHEELKGEIMSVKGDVGILRTDVAVLRTDVAEIRNDLNDHRFNTELHGGKKGKRAS
jgi:hypothetical protein